MCESDQLEKHESSRLKSAHCLLLGMADPVTVLDGLLRLSCRMTPDR